MERRRSLEGARRIVVLNPKGGSGKTTLATNIASLYAARGERPTLVDCDPQGFALRWLEKRSPQRPPIHGVAAYGDMSDGLPSSVQQVHPESRTIIVDLPAAVSADKLHTFTYYADMVVIPIVPSEIDVYSASRFIAELLLDVQLDRREQKLAIVANRVKANTRSFTMLRRFLGSLQIPLVATLRDTQNYVYAAAHGMGVCELPAYVAKGDISQLNTLAEWLDKWQERRFEAFCPPSRSFERVGESDTAEAPTLQRVTVD